MHITTVEVVAVSNVRGRWGVVSEEHGILEARRLHNRKPGQPAPMLNEMTRIFDVREIDRRLGTREVIA